MKASCGASRPAVPFDRPSPFLLWRLSKADTWAATVLLDEVDARGDLSQSRCATSSDAAEDQKD